MMTRWIGLAALAGLIGAASPARADAPIKFEEVFGLVRSNLTGISEADLNDLSRAAALEFIEKLRGRVELTSGAGADAPFIARTNLMDGFACIRIGRVREGVASQISETLKSAPKNKGLILDLRFATGDDYAAAVDVVNLFVAEERAVLKWSGIVGKTTARGDVFDLPLAILVNRQTSGSAEALAAALRDQSLGLVIGRPTAGQANVFDDFPLSSGQHLKIARSKVELPDGKSIGPEGLAPDTMVVSDEASERRWLNDPYLVIGKPAALEYPAPVLTVATNRLSRRPNGAEISRRHRIEQEEIPSDERVPTVRAPVVQDAALARALDFLKGVAVTRERDARAK